MGNCFSTRPPTRYEMDVNLSLTKHAQNVSLWTGILPGTNAGVWAHLRGYTQVSRGGGYVHVSTYMHTTYLHTYIHQTHTLHTYMYIHIYIHIYMRIYIHTLISTIDPVSSLSIYLLICTTSKTEP